MTPQEYYNTVDYLEWAVTDAMESLYGLPDEQLEGWATRTFRILGNLRRSEEREG